MTRRTLIPDADNAAVGKYTLKRLIKNGALFHGALRFIFNGVRVNNIVFGAKGYVNTSVSQKGPEESVPEPNPDGEGKRFFHRSTKMETKTRTRKTLVSLAEGGISIALALALSYVDIPLGIQGGSFDLVMVPLFVFALRHGLAHGITAGFAFGTLKYFLSNGFAISWVSILFDYSGAYAVTGLAALAMLGAAGIAVTTKRTVLGVIIGGLARFAVHYVSGVTVYAQWMPEEYMGLPMTTPFIYSFLYNGLYMIPNIIAAAIVAPIVVAALRRAKL